MTTPPAKKVSRGGGRHCIYADEAMKPKAIRMTSGQRKKLERLGGDQWVRDQIDKAK